MNKREVGDLMSNLQNNQDKFFLGDEGEAELDELLHVTLKQEIEDILVDLYNLIPYLTVIIMTSEGNVIAERYTLLTDYTLIDTFNPKSKTPMSKAVRDLTLRDNPKPIMLRVRRGPFEYTIFVGKVVRDLIIFLIYPSIYDDKFNMYDIEAIINLIRAKAMEVFDTYEFLRQSAL